MHKHNVLEQKDVRVGGDDGKRRVSCHTIANMSAARKKIKGSVSSSDHCETGLTAYFKWMVWEKKAVITVYVQTKINLAQSK